MEEHEILAGLLKRDQLALNTLMNVYITAVYTLCSSILGGAGTTEDIEECTSDVFYMAWKSVDKYDTHRAKLRTWVLMIAKYVALERRRTLIQKVNQLPFNEEIISLKIQETMFSTIEARETLQSALKTLTVQERELIYRRYFLDESIKDLVSCYGLSRQSIDNRLWRAKKSLKNFLKTRKEGIEER